MKQQVKLGFCDFYRGFDPKNNFFYRLLSQRYDIQIDNQHPDYLIYSVFGNEYLKYTDCIRIFWTGENQTPDFNFCDYALGFDYLDFGDRYMRLPLYFIFADYEKMPHKHENIKADECLNRGFCSFVYSNCNAASYRQALYDALSAYKPIASGGRYMNNVGGPVADKVAFQHGYKFCIACENSSTPGYSTEKLMQAFASQTVPIYWGDPEIKRQFNAKSFICAADFESLEELAAFVRELDQDDERYLEMLRQPALNDMQLRDRMMASLDAFFEHIFSQDKLSAQRYNRDYWGDKLRLQRLQETAVLKNTLKGHLSDFYNKYLFTFMRNHCYGLHNWLRRKAGKVSD